MADKRMVTKKITDNDSFISLSASSQALYLHLMMSADDDGFSNQVAVSMYKAHANNDDLQQLINKKYIYQFDSGVVVIKHWKMHNCIKTDRYKATAYQEEKKKLTIKDNGVYTMETEWRQNGDKVETKRFQTVSNLEPQNSIDKISIDKIKDSSGKTKRFTPPTLQEVTNFINEYGLNFDANVFIDYYNSNGWMVGRNHMKNWEATARRWGRTQKKALPTLKSDTAIKDNDMEKLYAEMFG